MNDAVKKTILIALETAESIARSTNNPFDDIVVSAACSILKRALDLEV